jgi:hypothetical protein
MVSLYDQTQVLVWLFGIEAGLYCIPLAFLLYMTYAFLVKLKFYREWHITVFYILSILILLFRIINFILEIFYIKGVYKEVRIDFMLIFDFSNTYLKVFLGLVQVKKLTEIATDVKTL